MPALQHLNVVQQLKNNMMCQAKYGWRAIYDLLDHQGTLFDLKNIPWIHNKHQAGPEFQGEMQT